LDTFLQPVLTRLEKLLDESLTLSREELQQCLNIICGCLSGAAILLPDWKRPPLENLGLKTLVSRGRFQNTVSMEPEVSMGEHNSRARIAELIHRLLGKTVYLQAWVVRKVNSAIHRINHYPADSEVCFVNTYPLDSDLSGGLDSVIQPSNNCSQILNI